MPATMQGTGWEKGNDEGVGTYSCRRRREPDCADRDLYTWVRKLDSAWTHWEVTEEF